MDGATQEAKGQRLAAEQLAGAGGDSLIFPPNGGQEVKSC
jgi:hypothetical protein